MLERIVVSKQCDHDIDLAPFWLHWYRRVFAADKLIVTPVKTPASRIDQTVRFYSAQGVSVSPLELAKWSMDEVWRRQLEIVRAQLSPNRPFVLVFCDTDQFFGPVDERRLWGKEVVFHRINMHSQELPTAENIGQLKISANLSFDLIAGFVNTLESPLIHPAGHYYESVAGRRRGTLHREFHLRQRGFQKFHEKVREMVIDQDGQPASEHWKEWRRALDQGGEAALQAVYLRDLQRMTEMRPEKRYADLFRSLAAGTPVDAKELAPRYFPFAAGISGVYLKSPAAAGGRHDFKLRSDEDAFTRAALQQHYYALPCLADKPPSANPFYAVDIGAGNGLFTVLVKLQRPNAVVHCFEPEKGALGVLAFNIRGLKQVMLHNTALGGFSGEASLWLSDQSSAGHSLNPSFCRHFAHDKVRVWHTGETLSKLNLPRIDLLKLDTVGTEMEILKALGSTLSRVQYLSVRYYSDVNRREIDALLSGFRLCGFFYLGPGEGIMHFAAKGAK